MVDAGVSAVIPPDALYATSEKVSNRMMVSPGLPSAGSTSTTASSSNHQGGGGGGLGDATATTPLEGSKVRGSYRESDTLLLLVAAVEEEVEEGEPSRTLVRKGNKWQRGGEIKTKSPDGSFFSFFPFDGLHGDRRRDEDLPYFGRKTTQIFLGCMPHTFSRFFPCFGESHTPKNPSFLFSPCLRTIEHYNPARCLSLLSQECFFVSA